METSSSKNKIEFIDLTILNTPKPQASSTIEKKGVYSFRNNIPNTKNCDSKNIKSKYSTEMDVPTRDTDTHSNSSRHSSLSSLGILSMDNVEDIMVTTKKGNVDSRSTNRKSNINESLARQRHLAQKAMDKVDLKTKENIGGLPSYLLKPSGTNNTIHTVTPSKDESTINLSDLEKISASDKISFEVKEITARSSSLGNQNNNSVLITDVIHLRSPSPIRGLSTDFAAKCQDICDRLRQSDVSLAAICDRSSKLGMHTQPLGSLPLPEIETIDLSDDSWVNGQQDSLVAKLQNELFTPAELAGDKLRADELSWRKAKDILPVDKVNSYLDLSCFSGYIGDCDISQKSKSDKVSISEFFKQRTEDVENLNLNPSPERKQNPVPLINITNTSIQDNEPEITSNRKDSTRMSSVLSVSQIANVLSNMDIQESPSKILNVLLKKSQNNLFTSPGTSSDSSTLKNSQIKDLASPALSNSDTLKENLQTVIKNNKSPRKSDEVLRDMTNLNNDVEWIDAKSKVGAADEIKSVSSLTESSSYSCSELEFSEDDSSLNDDWIHFDTIKPFKFFAKVPHTVPIHFSSKSNHWLQLNIGVKEIIILDNSQTKYVPKIEILSGEGVLKPYSNQKFTFKVSNLNYGKFKIVFRVDMVDILTKTKQCQDNVVVLEVEDPKIKLGFENLDFKLNPECSVKRLILPITNESSSCITISAMIVQEHDWVFAFGSNSEINLEKCEKVQSQKVITIPAGDTTSVAVDMRCPNLDELNVSAGIDTAVITGCIKIHFSEVRRPIKVVKLTGRIGFTKVQFKTSCMPFVLLPGQTKPLQVRNSGTVPLDLSVVVIEADSTNSTTTSDNIFSIDTKNLTLKSGQIGTVNITFNARDNIQPVKRVIRLKYPNGPNFSLPIEGILGSRSPDIKSNDRVSPRRPGSGSSGTSHSSTGSVHAFPDGKLPIESTKTELVWGCVRPGRTSTQEFVLRNRCPQRVRLQAVIQGSPAYKFAKENSENATSTNLVLQAMESRTISVAFCPNSKGATTARLMFLPIDHETSQTKRQMIQLYGYGGYIAVDIQKLAKDTSGRMWLSFGRLDYQETLHQVFILRNIGSLSAFVSLSVTCKVLYPFMDSSVNISPTEAVIEPNKEIEVSVNFSPRPEDFKYIQKTSGMEVSEIASIKIMMGPEPTRGRIRRLFNKLNTSNINGNTPGQLTSSFVVPRLSSIFPGEKIPADVATCREGGSALRELLRDVDTRDLTLTVERAGIDTTTTGVALDNTLMFQSLAIADSTSLNMTVTGRASGGFCSVDPKKIVVLPTEEGTVFVRSHHSRPMPFEVCVPPTACEVGVQVSPTIGVLSPGDAAAVTIHCNHTPPRLPFTCVLMIYVENEVMEVELKIQSQRF